MGRIEKVVKRRMKGDHRQGDRDSFIANAIVTSEMKHYVGQRLEDCVSDDEIRAYVDAELKRIFREKYSQAVIDEMPAILLTLVCVVMEGTHFVTLEAIQAELTEMGLDVPDTAIQPHLERWRTQPFPVYQGILH